NEETVTFDPGQISAITVNCGAGDDTVNIDSTTSQAPVTVNGGTGSDTFNIRPSVATKTGGSQDTLLGAVTVHGGTDPNGDYPVIHGSIDHLIVNDQADAFGGDVYTITSSTVGRTAMAQISYDTVESLVVNGGKSGDTYNINSTASTTPVTVIAGAGNDTFN